MGHDKCPRVLEWVGGLIERFGVLLGDYEACGPRDEYKEGFDAMDL